MMSKRAAANDLRAEFEALYARHSREVWAMAYARWMDADLALDIAQEAFLRLWKHWEAGDDEDSKPAGLALESGPQPGRGLREEFVSAEWHQSPAIHERGASAGAAPLDNMEQAELFAQIRATLEELPQGDRDILTLRYALEYDAAKIAELLEINATAVHMRLSRARQKLADKLTAQGTTKIL